MTRFNLEELIDQVPHNGTLRFHCPNPECRGYYSLGITKENGKVKWNCFKLNCSLHGRKKYNRNISELRTQLEGSTEAKQEFRLPDYLVHGLSSEKTLQMIVKGNCLEVYRKGLFDIAYDPMQDRVCFVVKNVNKVVGLVGRACNYKTKPKVLNYANSDLSVPFTCGSGNTIVLVEDGFSAASVARIPELTGLSLFGSSLKDEYIPFIKPYSRVIVALDRDARKKALAIKSKLGYHHKSVGIWFLDKDIKDQSNEELTNGFNSLL